MFVISSRGEWSRREGGQGGQGGKDEGKEGKMMMRRRRRTIIASQNYGIISDVGYSAIYGPKYAL